MFHAIHKTEDKKYYMQSTRETVFDNVYYKQIDGVTVGSPLGPTLVNLLLPYFKRKRLDNCPIQFRPRSYQEHCMKSVRIRNFPGAYFPAF